MTILHRFLYRHLSLENYLRVVSGLFFLTRALGIGRYARATEYVYALDSWVRPGDTCIDIGANLGYYTRSLSRLVGAQGKVYAVEPMLPILRVLQRNVRRCKNVEILPYALGEENTTIRMTNRTPETIGYFGTGRNEVDTSTDAAADAATGRACTFEAEMRRGSELFAACTRIDFIKCDIEGYEWHVMSEMRPLLERHHPIVLIETGGENRPLIIRLFQELGYEGYTLQRGDCVPLTPESDKDILFLPTQSTKPCE